MKTKLQMNGIGMRFCLSQFSDAVADSIYAFDLAEGFESGF